MLRCSMSKREIIQPLALIQGVVDKKTVMSLLKNVYLRADGQSGLIMEGTDLERSLRCRLQCDVQEQGEILVDAKQLYEIIKEFPSDNITLWEDEDKWLHIEGAESASYKLGGLEATDFPRFMELPDGEGLTLDSSLITKMVEKTIYASATSDGEDRYGFTSMLVEFISGEETGEGDLIRSVCTNGHRLALFDQPLDQPPGSSWSLLLPRKSAMEMRRVAEASDGSFTLKREDKFCFLSNDELTLIVRLTTDAEFPKYKLILPQEKEPQAIIDRIALYNALKRVTIVTADGIDTRGVIATLSSRGMELEPIQKERGDAKEIIPIDLLVEEEIQLAFNARYMMEALNVMTSAEIRFSYPNLNAPCFIWGEEDPGYLAFIMPLKID